jgi:hypothetical protein
MSKHTAEMIEGPEAFERFNKTMKAVIAVPHSVIKERIEKARKESLENPKRRGPKPKIKPKVS